MNIREEKKEDAAALIKYLNQIGGESDNLLFGKDEIKISVEKEESFIEASTKGSKNIMLVAVEEGEIIAVGSMQGFFQKRIAHRGSLAISVRKDYWHQGVGSQMMEALLAFAKSVDMTVIELEVKSNNKNAIALYQKFGFQKIGTYPKFFKINGQYYDANLMNLYFN